MSMRCENERGFETFLAKHHNTENERGEENSLTTSDTSCRRHQNERNTENFVTTSETSRRCHNKSPEPGKALLSVGSGGVGLLPIISTPLSRPIPVASVSIDTTNMCNPKVLLTFTALIVLPATILVNLNFIIVKTIDCGAPQPIGGTFTFAELAGALESESFSFQFCDCSPSTGGTTYTVQLEPSSLISVTAGLTITNATLSALAVESL